MFETENKAKVKDAEMIMSVGWHFDQRFIYHLKIGRRSTSFNHV